jgi:hypothetical protein
VEGIQRSDMPKGKGKRRIAIDRGKLLSIVRDLNTIVVSIDHIGSSFDDRKACDKAALTFFDESWVWRKLSEMRSQLHDLFPRKLGPDGMDELERELQDVPYWSQKHPKPPKEYVREVKRRWARFGR